jgi:hypothetical protein
MLRDIRRKPASGEWLSVSGADPLNLAGVLTPGSKLPALTGNRLLYRDGLPVAVFAADEVQFLETLDPSTEWEARKALLRVAGSTPSIDPGAKVDAESDPRVDKAVDMVSDRSVARQ